MKPSNPPYLGAAYYPEDWPLEQIDADIALMKEAGTNVMRVGEFAWSRMEPEEGRYDFDWLHLVVEKLGAAGISVIMCTPTCTPPIWLVEKYPEVLFVRADGKPTFHGARRHACPNSPSYREHAERIVAKMAEEFGQDSRIIGWQIDNEVHPLTWNRPCVCPVCRKEFAERMKARFGTIEALNAAWGTDLWSQTYQSFDQLPIPDPDTWHHPSLQTAWSAFTSDSYVEFVKHQAEILHRLTKHPIGTDMMPTHGVDYGDMHRALDVVQFNHYNTMENLWQSAFWFDLCRPIKPAPFWNTETQTCWSGSIATNGYREPGFCRANTWLPIAMGGEANLYWLWRQHRSGQELMHGAVVTSAGRPMHTTSEVREVSEGFAKAAEFLNGTRPTKSGLALHYSHKSAWISEWQPLVNGFHYTGAILERAYRPLIGAQFRPDVIMPSADLDGYRMLFSPFLLCLDEAGLRERLRAWIEAGGTWIAGPMTDIRDADAAKFTHSPFGSLEEWAGVYCRYEIPGEPRDFGVRWSDGRESQGSVWYDGFELRGAEALATYMEGPMTGLAAVAQRRMGDGRIILLGTMPQASDLRELFGVFGQTAGVNRACDATEGLIVVPREGTAGRGMVVVEIENRAAGLVVREPVKDLLTGQMYGAGGIKVSPYGVMVLIENG